MTTRRLPPYRESLAGTLLAARESVMRPIRLPLAEAGFTEQQWRVLRVLIDQGEIEPMRLADAAMLHAPSVTRILRELSNRKLIERRSDSRDGRRSIIEPTAAARELVDRVSEQTLLLFDQYNEAFGRARLDALRAELAALVASLSSFQPTD